MAKVRENLNLGDKENITLKDLIDIIDEAYRDLAIALNKKPDIYLRELDGDTADNFLSDGDLNVNTSTNNIEIVSSRSADGSTLFWKTL